MDGGNGADGRDDRQDSVNCDIWLDKVWQKVGDSGETGGEHSFKLRPL